MWPARSGRHSLFFFSSRRRHTSWPRDWSSDVCSSDLEDASVGAALLAADGRVFTGANVENPSYGLSMCAERVAVGAAAAAGARSFVAIAVAGDSPGGLVPCGACRQVLAEFSPDLLVIRCRPDGSYEKFRMRDLMPTPLTGKAMESTVQSEMELAAR